MLLHGVSCGEPVESGGVLVEVSTDGCEDGGDSVSSDGALSGVDVATISDVDDADT